MLLNSSAPKGICYIETKNLDGETNLKHKQSIKALIEEARDDRSVLKNMMGGHVECENPNEMLYRFEGTLVLREMAVPLNVDQILLRGSSLRNTEYIYGLVVFTGHDSKVMRNSVKSKAKFSKLERATNHYIIIIAGIQILFALISAILNTFWEIIQYDNFQYIRGTDESAIPWL